MNFEYSDEQQQLADSIRKYLANDYSFDKRKAILQLAPRRQRAGLGHLRRDGPDGDCAARSRRRIRRRRGRPDGGDGGLRRGAGRRTAARPHRWLPGWWRAPARTRIARRCCPGRSTARSGWSLPASNPAAATSWRPTEHAGARGRQRLGARRREVRRHRRAIGPAAAGVGTHRRPAGRCARREPVRRRPPGRRRDAQPQPHRRWPARGRPALRRCEAGRRRAARHGRRGAAG